MKERASRTPTADVRRDDDLFVITYTFSRPVELDDVARCGKALQRLLNALAKQVTGNRRAKFPLALKDMKYIPDGSDTLTFRIRMPATGAQP